MKNKFKIVLLLTFLLLALFSCKDRENSENTSDIKIFFLNKQTNELEGEYFSLEKARTDDDKIKAVFEFLKQGPSSTSALIVTVPKEIEILAYDLNEDSKNIEIDLSQEYDKLSANEQNYLRASITESLCELDFINSVDFKVNGKKILMIDGSELSSQKPEDIIEGEDILPPIVGELHELKLYFTDYKRKTLIAEVRTVRVNISSSSIERRIIDELLEGPKTEGLISTLPKDIKVKNISTTEDGTCYVDLSKEFYEKIKANKETEYLAVFAIVNSLVEINKVKQVQFLADGEKLEKDMMNFELRKPIKASDYE